MYNSSGHVLKTQVLESCTRATITCMCPHPHLELVGIALSNRKVYILDKVGSVAALTSNALCAANLVRFVGHYNYWIGSSLFISMGYCIDCSSSHAHSGTASSGSIICHSDDGRLSLWNGEARKGVM